MDLSDFLCADGRVVLALCSHLALTEDLSAEGHFPFTLTEWDRLARQIRTSPLRTPAALEGMAEAQVADALPVTRSEAGRIAGLLGRAGRIRRELDRLRSSGIWAVTCVDEHYPARLRATLKHQAPAVLFGAGNLALAGRAGIGVVGSRNIDTAGAAFAKNVGRKAVEAGFPVVSGGARGTDQIAMNGAVEAGGAVVGALADSLEAAVRNRDIRELLTDGRLMLLTQHAPSVTFSTAVALGRNKLIYGLSEFAVVVSADFRTGGTWAGAVEALKGDFCPVFVRAGESAPRGNRELLKLGGVALPETEFGSIDDLGAWLRRHTGPRLIETDLFEAADNKPKTRG